MANEKNLKSLSERTTNEQREIAKKGGKKSGEVRQARKTLKEELLLLLSNGDTQSRISLSLIEQAINGSTKAFEIIRDTIGEKPVDRLETTEAVRKIFITKADEKEANKKIDDFIKNV